MLISLDETTAHNLQLFSEILKKEPQAILKEALEAYIEAHQKKMNEKNRADDSAQTNLDFDEFWDGVEL